MSRQIKFRRGSAAEHAEFTGAIGEVTMDTTNNTLRVHDGKTVGGTVLAKQNEILKRPDFFNYTIAQNNTVYFADFDYIAVISKGSGNEAVLSISDNENMLNFIDIINIFGTTSQNILKTQSFIPKGCYFRFQNFDEVKLCKMI